MKRDDDPSKPSPKPDAGGRLNSPALDKRVAAYSKSMQKSAPEEPAGKKVSAWRPPTVARKGTGDAAPAKPRPAPAPERPASELLPPGRRLFGSGRPEDEVPKGGFLKTGLVESKHRKVAKFLLLVGIEEAARILKGLGEDQAEPILAELATVSRIEAAEAERLLEEFRGLLPSARLGGEAHGGVDTARALLRQAFGAEKGEALLRRVVPDAVRSPYAFLEDYDGEHVALLLRDESPGAVALVLSRLSPKLAAASVSAMDEGLRLDVLKRIAKQGKVSPDILERSAEALREKARRVGRHRGESVDGKAALAEILKHVDPTMGDRILDDLEEGDPDLGRDVKDRLFTLDDIIKVPDRSVQEKLRSMTDKDIAILIKGRRPSFVEKLLSNVSENRRLIIEEERVILGPLPRADIEEAARDFLAWFRVRNEEGRIVLMDEADLV